MNLFSIKACHNIDKCIHLPERIVGNTWYVAMETFQEEKIDGKGYVNIANGSCYHTRGRNKRNVQRNNAMGKYFYYFDAFKI